jgi:hypothetical protein
MRVLVMTSCALFNSYRRDQAWFSAIIIWLLSNVAHCSLRCCGFVVGAGISCCWQVMRGPLYAGMPMAFINAVVAKRSCYTAPQSTIPGVMTRQSPKTHVAIIAAGSEGHASGELVDASPLPGVEAGP